MLLSAWPAAELQTIRPPLGPDASGGLLIPSWREIVEMRPWRVPHQLDGADLQALPPVPTPLITRPAGTAWRPWGSWAGTKHAVSGAA